jgi:hypothetical protein
MPRTRTSAPTLLDQPAKQPVVIQRLDAMMADDEYDTSFLRPSEEAYRFARSVMESAASKLSGQIPRATPAPVGDGGIFVQFGTPERYVRVLVPAEPSGAYLAVVRDGQVETIAGFNGNDLAERLRDLSLT